MPIYEYECSRCHEIFEIFHKIDEECKVACPKCLGSAKKLISATNFVLKGSGFYVNDYPSKSRREGKKADKDSGGGKETSGAKETSGTSPSDQGGEKRADKKAD